MSAVRIFADECDSPDYNPLEQALHAWEIRRSGPKESHRIGLDLIDHALEIDDQLVTAWAYLTCGAHELANSELQLAATESFECAAKLFKRMGEKRGESLSQIALARLYMTNGQFHPALELYKSIIEREAHGLTPLEKFEAFNSIGGCFWGLDKLELCLLYLSKAFEVLRNTNFVTERATVLGNIGSALLSVGNYDTAYDFLVAAAKYSRSADNRMGAFNIQASLVACLNEMKDHTKALPIATRLVKDFEDLLFVGPYNVALCNVAIAFANAKQWQLSEYCLAEAQKIAQNGQVAHSLAAVALAEAQVAEARGNFAVAIAHAESLLDNSSSVTNDIRSQALSVLVNGYQKIGNHEAAVRAKKKKLELSDLRYQSGLAAAMVVLELGSSLKNLQPMN